MTDRYKKFITSVFAGEISALFAESDGSEERDFLCRNTLCLRLEHLGPVHTPISKKF